ncbi:MAG: hypothetical protein A3E78_00340 [Alphaproteobacteria bacterium RIFCSPHIGHO2_12_FULL_63_12]|nr:MAG: hypothetical protein A3E78_00340 [Alphaproteobacteria bacterium RIFCSPHIGHO2_12_FULL_63_12]
MFQPAIPIGGYAGWKVFERTVARQKEAFGDQAAVQRDLAYFKEKISSIHSPEELVRDRKLLTVALGAFGLEDEINKKAFIRRALDDGVLDPRSFANRLNDPRWRAFATAFSAENLALGRFELNSSREDVAARFIERAFERSVGDVDPNFRLAMNFRREAKEIASGVNADRIGWLQIMGQRPLRAVVEAALGLPSSIANLDIDRQRQMFETKAAEVFGTSSPKAFLDDANIEQALRRFFVRSEADSGPSADTRGAAALSLLGGSALSAGAQIGLIISNASVR